MRTELPKVIEMEDEIENAQTKSKERNGKSHYLHSSPQKARDKPHTTAANKVTKK